VSLNKPSLSSCVALGGLVALFLSHVAWVAPLNFYGFDEWTIHYLVSRGIVDNPYANRPLERIWVLPAHFLSPHSFSPYQVLYAAYAVISSWLVFLLCRRLVPTLKTLALLASSVFLVWAPRDLARLSHFERAVYTGFVFGVLLAFTLFVESWVRRNEVLLILSILAAFVAARSYEGTIALLLSWPLFVAWALKERSRRYWMWAAAWEGFVLWALVLIVQPLLFPKGVHSYQAGLVMDTNVLRLSGRLLSQYTLELAPLFASPWKEVLHPGVVLATLVFFLLSVLWGVLERRAPEIGARAVLVAVMTGGLALAGLGLSVLTLAVQRRVPPGWRMQFLPGPGIAVFLSASILLLVTVFPLPLRRPFALLLGCCVVAVGTGRTLAMQRAWDSLSFHGRQVRMLTELTELAPDLRPHTLVVAIDERRKTWRSDWGFRHAVQYLYQERAMGYVWNGATLMFPTRWMDAGVACTPWPEVQAAWHAPATLHLYEELVVVLVERGGKIRLADDWPDSLPPLPPGARYEPRARIVPLAGPLPERRVLQWGLVPSRRERLPR
jgi:hypothetical protein